MSKDNVLVLGARVKNGAAQPVLLSRLRRALRLVDELDHAGKHPSVVVSGRGEAEVMAEWLKDQGLATDRILVEPHATSTNENLENAHALLPETRRWWTVTNEFHAWRTRLWAWHLGVPVKMVTARTPRQQRGGNYLREIFATPHSALRVLWRKIRG
ncbi:hypothetical protein B841_03395 [Corynebacterium maris DSM 45190]|uniref:DUF218 domain-containing protein n=1 Tax=Corynebacterium maris DSM 45190 TaxID=1224163 RepID=S5SSY8_9CORY|nr:YdcF family protein [Corynebacterium maris]AGS34162.1 hypothetical protein B841_03395 [Corynebacterium maris DSM 45190]